MSSLLSMGGGGAASTAGDAAGATSLGMGADSLASSAAPQISTYTSSPVSTSIGDSGSLDKSPSAMDSYNKFKSVFHGGGGKASDVNYGSVSSNPQEINVQSGNDAKQTNYSDLMNYLKGLGGNKT